MRLTVWNYSPADTRNSTGLDIASIDCEDCKDLVATIEQVGLHVAIWDVTSDIGIATFLCLIGDLANPNSHIGLGSGTHTDRRTALARALTEAAQTRMNYITGSRDDLQFEEFTVQGRLQSLVGQRHCCVTNPYCAHSSWSRPAPTKRCAGTSIG